MKSSQHLMPATFAAVMLAVGGAPFVALAQTAPPSVTRAESVTARVTVQSVDVANRRVVVKAEDGEAVTLKAPAEFRNLDTLKPGDKISVTYARATEIVIAKPGQELPKDSESVAMARAAKGELPAGAIANRLVVTGAIVGIDLQHSMLKLVSPQGGEVVSFQVTSPEGRAALPKLKVGDKITAYITEGLLISTERS